MSDEKQQTGATEAPLEFEGLAAGSLPPSEPEPAIAAPEPEPELESPAEAEAQVMHSDAPAAESNAAAEIAEDEPELISAPPAEPVDEASVVSIATLESDKPAMGDKLNAGLTGIGAFLRGRGWVVGAIVVVLLLIFLFLPPISLGERLPLGNNFATLTPNAPTTSHEDGIWVHALPPVQNLRVRLSTVPMAEFVAGNVQDDLKPALSALPAHLDPRSPYYIIEMRGRETGPAAMEITIPNEAEPWETLDLYTWNGDAWQWIPTRLDRDELKLHSEVAALPKSVMVMRTRLTQPTLAAEVDTLPLGEASQVINEISVPGTLIIGTLGDITGNLANLPAASAAEAPLMPVLRNWAPGRDANWALVVDMLETPAYRRTHIDRLVEVVTNGGYAGLVLDYRMLPAEASDLYASFTRDLAAALHAEGARLAVTVDMPRSQPDGSWDTGGYDWQALGMAADQLRVEMPLNPEDYAPGGKVEHLLTWAISQVDRYKLLPIYSTLSTDGQDKLSMDEVLASMGQVRVTQTLTESVEPGTPLNFELGAGASIEDDIATGATRLIMGAQSWWLGSPQWLRTRLDLTARYNLGGVLLRDLTAEGNAPNLTAAIADYRAQVHDATYALPDVMWTVTAPDGEISQLQAALSQPTLAWRTPEMTGTYRIAATVAGMDKGTVEIQVLDSRPAVVEEEPPDEDDATAVDPEPTTPAQTEQLRAAFVTDVTIPDNTRMEQGEAFVKTWRLRNAGNAPWPANTVLAFSSGEQMTDAREVTVGEVAPGDTADISVDMSAPGADGTFRSVWRLTSGEQQIEGGGVFVQIIVGEEAAAAPPPDTSPGPVPPVSGGGFALGGHIRDYGLPHADKMRHAGMTWTKIQAHFADDKAGIIQASHANGFKIQVSAIGPRGMVTEPGYEQRYAEWVAGIAAAGADAIEIWNEPNIDREWQIGHISPQAYTNLLCTSYRAIKAANPNTAVISAAPAPTGYFGGCSQNGCDDIPWMQGLVAAGAMNCMDYVGAHHNAGATSPSARSGHPTGSTHHSWYFLPQTEAYYNIFGGRRKIFYTEMGYASQEGVPAFSDAFAWARGITNAQQAAWLAEAASVSANTGMVRVLIIWNIDFGRFGYDPQDGYAIVRPGGGCPACETLHQVMGGR